ncbi:hypothetical protein BDP81DRAFT_432318 [Colletotrichum phormii]|uniref:Secreted protein n=1 Tax=Colletotrichum phormii TaxID=359342 RepID=A0AAI9ZQH9_9PEZI|nr:uncharacterized protein BDP81DRAFT_432318 [Colletotrichum phormii]KAK1634964.1 hypothetical protein BDP81DRAFT_432318 [Colletotrichum phormii]
MTAVTVMMLMMEALPRLVMTVTMKTFLVKGWSVCEMMSVTRCLSELMLQRTGCQPTQQPSLCRSQAGSIVPFLLLFI